MSDRKTHWEKVYANHSPHRVSWYQEEPSLSLRLIRSTKISHDAAIIDIGAGASTLVDSLCNEGYSNISVLEISSTALDHVKHRLAAKTRDIAWHNDDVLDFNPPRRYSTWHDRAVFHFLTEQADRDRYVEVLKRSLEHDGHVIIMTFAIDGPIRCSGLDIVQYDADKLLQQLGPGFELAETGLETHTTPACGQQNFAYFRLTRMSGTEP